MSAVESSEGQYPASANHALQVALQTLRERCQIFQKRLATLEEENLALRSVRVRSPVAGPGQFRDRKVTANAAPAEMELLRESVAELTRQKAQLADQISMVAAENRQLWRRLSQIAKDVPVSFADGDGEANAGYSPTTARLPPGTNREVLQRTTASSNQPGQNLIRSRTFTKNAPNPKLRERLHRDGSSDDELLNLEDISLLNTCGFLETVGGADLLQLSLLTKHDEEQLQAALEANPDIRRCTEGLSDMRNRIEEQGKALRDVFNGIKLSKGMPCNRCQNRQPSTEEKKLTKDVTVEVAECELLPLDDDDDDDDRAGKGRLGATKTTRPKEELSGGTLPPDPAANVDYNGEGGEIDSLLEEKLRANERLEKLCPICAKLYGSETIFDVFQQHVESHFLDDSEMGELSLDRTYDYISHTVGNF